MDASRWNHVMQAMVLIRIGQELGGNTPAARAVHDLLELLAGLAGVFLK